MDSANQLQQVQQTVTSYLLVLVGISLAVGDGPYTLLIGLLQLSLLVSVTTCLVQHHRLPWELVALLSLPVLLLTLQWLAPDSQTHKYSTRNLLAYVAIAGCLFFIRAPFTLHRSVAFTDVMLGLSVLPVIVHPAAMLLGHRWGLFDNHHYLTLLCLVGLVLSGHLAIRHVGGRRYLAVAAAAGYLLMMLVIPAAIGYLSLLIALLVVGLLVWNSRIAWFVSAACLVLLTLLLPWINLARSIKPAINEQVAAGDFWIQDERSIIWLDSWRMQLDAQALAWLTGKGWGAFRDNFHEYSRLRDSIDFVFPHNFFLETLYNAGVAGLLALLVSIGLLVRCLYVASRRSVSSASLLLVALFVAVFLYTFLTLPLLSRYSAYLFGFVVGVTLVVYRGETASE